MDSVLKEQILKCKSYAEAIRILYGKNYTNGRLRKLIKKFKIMRNGAVVSSPDP